MPDIANYINGAVGPYGAEQLSQDNAEIEKGIAPERDAPFMQSASQDKEEMDTFENSQAFQPVMPVPAQSFIGSNRNVFGPMVPMAPGAFPVPSTEDGYGGNAAVRSEVPEGEEDEDKKEKDNKGDKKQCINGTLNLANSVHILSKTLRPIENNVAHLYKLLLLDHSVIRTCSI